MIRAIALFALLVAVGPTYGQDLKQSPDGASGAKRTVDTSRAATSKPNILFILVDDKYG